MVKYGVETKGKKKVLVEFLQFKERRESMGKYIKRKNLTPEQYWMANKTMTIVLMVCYAIRMKHF